MGLGWLRQMDRFRIPNTESRVHCQLNSCWISDGQSGNGADFSLSTQVSHSLQCSVFTCYRPQLTSQKIFQERFKATTVVIEKILKKKISPLTFD
jgi:hypothetical protein